MKPNSPIAANGTRFPIVEFHYRPMMLDGYRGRCAGFEVARFRNISAEYFQKEARHDFLTEAVCFALFALVAVVPFVNATSAVMELCRAFAQF